jgi:hypothetical protein
MAAALVVLLAASALPVPIAGIAMKARICVKPPPGCRSLLKFREELELLVTANNIPVRFVGMLGGLIVEGEAGHVERFVACYQTTR